MTLVRKPTTEDLRDALLLIRCKRAGDREAAAQVVARHRGEAQPLVEAQMFIGDMLLNLYAGSLVRDPDAVLTTMFNQLDEEGTTND